MPRPATRATATPDSVDVGNEPVVGAFRKGRANYPITHGLLVQLFTLQVDLASC